LLSISNFASTKRGFPFNKPVDPVALNIPTYFDAIKQPMDLGTVEASIKRGGVYG
jgi:bromodomain-containing factor 1